MFQLKSNPISITNPIKQLLVEIFQLLDRRNIQYAVLRNYDGLPDKIGNDLDLMVLDLNDFRSTLQEGALKAGWSLVREMNKCAFLSMFFISEQPGAIQTVQIDAWSPFIWKGIEIIPLDVLKQRIKCRGLFYTLAPGAEAAVSLIKGLVYHGKVQEKYQPAIPKMIRADRSQFLEAVKPCLGSQLSHTLADLSCSEDWLALEKLAPQIRWTAFLTGWRRNPLKQISQLAGFLTGHLRQFLHPTGLFVVLIGPDGSGKSTISQGLQIYLKKVFSQIKYFHGHFEILPRLRDLLKIFEGRFSYNGIDPDNTPHPGTSETIRFGVSRSLIYLFYYTLDYLMGYPIILSRKAKGDLIIFDRYFYDYLIQPGMSVPNSLIYGMMRLIPQPDVVIYLKNTPEIIVSRKNELSITELQRQSAACLQVVKKIKNAYIINTTNQPDETISHVAQLIINKLPAI